MFRWNNLRLTEMLPIIIKINPYLESRFKWFKDQKNFESLNFKSYLKDSLSIKWTEMSFFITENSKKKKEAWILLSYLIKFTCKE